MHLPAGYRLEWRGEFQQLRDALQRLKVIVPVTLVLIVALVYGYFKNVRDTLIVLTAVPLAVIGGVAALLVTGTNFSISAAVGFISLLGVAVLDGLFSSPALRHCAPKGAGGRCGAEGLPASVAARS